MVGESRGTSPAPTRCGMPQEPKLSRCGHTHVSTRTRSPAPGGVRESVGAPECQGPPVKRREWAWMLAAMATVVGAFLLGAVTALLLVLPSD